VSVVKVNYLKHLKKFNVDYRSYNIAHLKLHYFEMFFHTANVKRAYIVTSKRTNLISDTFS